MSRPTAPGRGGEEGRAANLAASPARCWPQVAGLAGDAAAIRADGRHLRGRGPRAQLRACVGRWGERADSLPAVRAERTIAAAPRGWCTCAAPLGRNPEGRVSRNASPGRVAVTAS